MKKNILLLLLVICAVVIAGCGESTSSSKPKKTVTVTKTTATVTTPIIQQPLAPAGNLAVNGQSVENPTVGLNDRFFAASSPWNTPVNNPTIDPNSDQYIKLANQTTVVVQRPNNEMPLLQVHNVTQGLYINTVAWTDTVVSGGTSTNIQCRQIICGDNAGISALDIPQDSSPNPLYDGWFSVLQGGFGYDFWRGRRLNSNTLSYLYMRKWDLSGPGYGAPGSVSARGSGLPLFAGIITPQELAQGSILHALAISLPGPAKRYYVRPASATDGAGSLNSLPEGSRIILKPSAVLTPPINPSTGKPIPQTAIQKRAADSIAWTLRHYGAIVVDRAAVPTLYAEANVTSKYISGNEVQGLHLSDFEVVQINKKYQDPPANQLPNGKVISPAAGQAGSGDDGSGGTGSIVF
jgi:hypothetical protein